MSHPVSPRCQKLILCRRRRARALVATPRQTRLLCLRRLPSDDRARRRCMRRFQGDQFSHPFLSHPFGHTIFSHPFCHTPFVTPLLSHPFCHTIFSHPFCHTPFVTPLLSHPFSHTPFLTPIFSHHFLTPFLSHPFFSLPLSFACATTPMCPVSQRLSPLFPPESRRRTLLQTRSCLPPTVALRVTMSRSPRPPPHPCLCTLDFLSV